MVPDSSVKMEPHGGRFGGEMDGHSLVGAGDVIFLYVFSSHFSIILLPSIKIGRANSNTVSEERPPMGTNQNPHISRD